MAKIDGVERGIGASAWPLIVVRLPRELFGRVKALAKESDLSRGTVAYRLIERGIKDALRKREGKPKKIKAKAKKASKKVTKITKKPADANGSAETVGGAS